MDVTADITTPTIWDIEQSPIRVNPSSGDYLQVSADLTIMPGVEAVSYTHLTLPTILLV